MRVLRLLLVVLLFASLHLVLTTPGARWFEPERIAPTSYLGPAGPNNNNRTMSSFTIHGPAPYPSSLLFDLGFEPAREYMTRYLSSSVRAFGLDYLRMDFNIDPAKSWALKDQQQAAATGRPLQSGLAETAHVEGLYKMWKQIITENPAVLLDNCASGGRRLDLETAALAVPLWQSDLAGNRGDVSESWQSQTMGLSNFLPVHSGGCPRWDSHTTSGPTGEKGLTPEVEPYVWRSCGTVGKAIGWPPHIWAALQSNATLASYVRTAVAETQRMRALVSDVDAEFFPLTPIDPTHPWAASQHSLRNGSAGFALVFARPPPAGPPLIRRLVENASDWSWALTAAPNTGYYTGKYDVSHTGIKDLTSCKSFCAASESCVGLTFVKNGGPPCAIYTSITGPFRPRKGVSNWAKNYRCGQGGSCMYGLDGAGERHAVANKPGSPFINSCDDLFVPVCQGEDCDRLLHAKDAPAGCPPYSGGSSSTTKDFRLRLRGLGSDAKKYRVTLFNESFAATGTRVLSAEQLSDLPLTMKTRSSLLLWFEAAV